MGAKQSIPAVYEDGVFKPFEPVYGVTNHAQVYLRVQTEAAMAQQIAESERLARESLEGLTEAQLAAFDRTATGWHPGYASAYPNSPMTPHAPRVPSTGHAILRK
jgi:predicted DNA-binding antitoxin AbrB/MazE fold protein